MSARTPAIYAVDIAHVRAEPVRHELRHRSYLWFVDLDDLPRHGALAGFESRDHVGDPTRSLRENLDDYLAANGTDLAGGRITMLTNARSLGYVFNPLSLYWCHDRAGDVVCVVAEVHNTYGDRHCYLLRPDADGHAGADKAFYVSPFFAVNGRYDMTFTDPAAASDDDDLRVAIALARDGRVVFRASVDGRPDPAAPSFLAGALRHPAAGRRVMALIRWQGIRLWLKHLPVIPRPAAPVQEGVTG
jgi:DUF1365 family protein